MRMTLDTHYDQVVRLLPTTILLRELERRRPEPPDDVDPVLRLPGLVVDRAWRTAVWRGWTARLTAQELRLLEVLIAWHPRPVPCAELARQLQYDAASVRVYVTYLRRKLPRLIPRLTSSSAGYWLDLEVG